MPLKKRGACGLRSRLGLRLGLGLGLGLELGLGLGLGSGSALGSALTLILTRRASWPRIVFFSKDGLPVIPWYANFTTTNPWTRPPRASSSALGEVAAAQLVRVRGRVGVGVGVGLGLGLGLFKG